jgi:RNA polymerase sigma-70 factor (ECF subfamily)
MLADAEDAVQESWFRIAGLTDAKRAEIRDRKAWLTTVVGRICLDRLRSATVQREQYIGQWLPEPIVTPLGTPPARTRSRRRSGTTASAWPRWWCSTS